MEKPPIIRISIPVSLLHELITVEIVKVYGHLKGKDGNSAWDIAKNVCDITQSEGAKLWQ